MLDNKYYNIGIVNFRLKYLIIIYKDVKMVKKLVNLVKDFWKSSLFDTLERR